MRHNKLADKIEEVISEPSKMEIKLKVHTAATLQLCVTTGVCLFF